MSFDIAIAAPGMIGLLAGRDIALGYEIDYLLPGKLIANKLLIIEYERYARALVTYELQDYLKKSVIQQSASKGDRCL